MSLKKKIAIIGTVGLPANYGGFETLAQHLAKNLNNEYTISVYCSSKEYKKEHRKRNFLNARLIYLPFKANGMQSILYDTISILHALFYADVLLILGVSGAWILPFAKLFTSKKIITSIDGIEWKRKKWGLLAKCYLFWSERLAVKYSHIDISDNESIQDYTAMRYGTLSKIIAYGADHVMHIIPEHKDILEFPFIKRPYACKVARIEPENNVDQVLEAFSKLPKYPLVIVGNWKNSVYGLNLRKKYASYENIILLDPIYNQRTLDVIRGNALIYIHGHSAGGTNPSLIEAMYLGLPVIAFGVSYNRTTTENKAIYFKNSTDLKRLIECLTINELKKMGKLMKSIAQRRYTWSLIAEKYKNLITEALTTENKISVKPQVSKIKISDLIEMELGHLKYQQLFFEKR